MSSDCLLAQFSSYGEIEEGPLGLDEQTGKFKGYSLFVFKTVEATQAALVEPSKKIDGRMTVTQLAAAGTSGPTTLVLPAADVSLRKIYVGNVPPEMSSDCLLAQFSSYGEIEEGPLGLDEQTDKFKGYSLFVFKTVEAAQAALVEPVKTIDGTILQCKLAMDGKKGRPGAAVPVASLQAQLVAGTGVDGYGDGLALDSHSSLPGSLSSSFGAHVGGFSSYGGFSGSARLPGVSSDFSQLHHLNSSLQCSIGLGNIGLSSLGSQAPFFTG
ncbi:hypothetical protein KSP40_PGU010375 [Platanthera guangdongensis]|uniref:RRM domain-containing protein n=1 Tax=Platanthera guangdongensis TaxID=2320717 RepID=A0ABR2LP92_9ASPA